jgi:hypothetical protein
MGPDKLLYDTFSHAKNVNERRVEGMGPESWFIDKSRDSSRFMFPIVVGIFPTIELLAKLKHTRPNRFVIILRNWSREMVG